MENIMISEYKNETLTVSEAQKNRDCESLFQVYNELVNVVNCLYAIANRYHYKELSGMLDEAMEFAGHVSKIGTVIVNPSAEDIADSFREKEKTFNAQILHH